MIQKYIYGNPFETEAVVKQIAESKDVINRMKVEQTGDSLQFSYKMPEEDIVYGLGEQVRGINKRGFSYISNAADDPVHTECKHSLYGAHNFLVVQGEDNWGIFVDDPGCVTFDIGETVRDELVIKTGRDCVIYLIEAETVKDIVKEFREMIGQSYIAPKWAFGYQQSRWGYKTDQDIRDVVKNHRENKIPLDAVYLDIDYMEDFKDFTIDQKRFPEFENFVTEMKQEEIHLVPIIDAGVKIEEGYSVYEEGVANNYFCKEKDGKDFVAAVWPGKVHFPDVLKKETREWFGGKYKVLTEKGIDGFWNDMNEPAIFYSEKRLKEAFTQLLEMKNQNLNIESFFHLKDIVSGLSNSQEDYESFYHEVNGEKICHKRIHNLYGYNMTKAAAEAFEKIEKEKRILMFSRSSYIGMHRYGGIWTGDNQSWWQQLEQSIKQMPALNMCGFLYTGSDIGGFGSDTTEDLLMRWIEFAIFTPLMRNHSALGTRDQEVYRFQEVGTFRNLIRIRYALLPYLYSEYMKAVFKNEMYFRALAFDYPKDAMAKRVEDQLMVGESIMIAPVYTQNAAGRYVYLPEDMLMVKMTSPEEMQCVPMKKGHHYLEIGLRELVIFIKENHAVPMYDLPEALKSTKELSGLEYRWLKNEKEKAKYTLYDDDGISKTYISQENWKTFHLEEDYK